MLRYKYLENKQVNLGGITPPPSSHSLRRGSFSVPSQGSCSAYSLLHFLGSSDLAAVLGCKALRISKVSFLQNHL